MKFLEKDLETLIWENYEACYGRGLRINQPFFAGGSRFRQMQLGQAGIADLVYVNYDSVADTCFIQVIECKREKVNQDTYAQAKRYARAVENLILDSYFNIPGERGLNIQAEVILVGDGVDYSGAFGPAISIDPNCHVYTYKYTLDGVAFEPRSTHWYMKYCDVVPERIAVQGELIVAGIQELRKQQKRSL